MVDGRGSRLPRRARAAGRVVVALLLAVSLTGCWFQEGGGAGNTRFNLNESALTTENVASLAVSWRGNVDAALSEPIIAGDRVYVTTRAGGDTGGAALASLSVEAFDRVTGALVWETSLLPDGESVEGDVLPVGLIGGALWVPYWHSGMPACTGSIARLDPASGDLLSDDATPTRPTSSVVNGPSVVAMTGYNCAGSSAELVVLDPATRARRWSHTFPVGHSASTPTVAGNMFVVRTSGPRVSSQTLYGFRAAGCSASVCGFSWDLRDTPFELGRPTAGPGGTVFDVVGADDGIHVRSVDAATGELRWTSSVGYDGGLPGALTGMAVDGNTLFVAGSQSSDSGPDVGRFDAYPAGGCGAATCDPLWGTTFSGGAKASTEPVVAGGVAYVGVTPGSSTEPGVAAVNADGCAQASCPLVKRVDLARSSGAPLQGSVPTRLSVGGGRVFVVWLPGLYGNTMSQLATLAPTTGP